MAVAGNGIGSLEFKQRATHLYAVFSGTQPVARYTHGEQLEFTTLLPELRPQRLVLDKKLIGDYIRIEDWLRNG